VGRVRRAAAAVDPSRPWSAALAARLDGTTLGSWLRRSLPERGRRRVTRTEHDGSITVLADSWDGARFNSPNDVVVRSAGST